MTFKKILTICSILILIPTIFIFFINFSYAQTTTSSTTPPTFIEYNNISSFDGTTQTTKIESAGTNGVNGLVNHLLFYGVIVITALVIFRILYGGFLKGTYDNIYDQNKGKQSIKVAGFALLILIFSYAVLSFINPRLTGWSLAVDNLKINVPNNGLANTGPGVCKIDNNYDQMTVQDEIKTDEQSGKYSPTIYVDSNQLYTIGWGFNLEQTGAKSLMQDANLDSSKIDALLSCVKDKNAQNCSTSLTEEEADNLFNVSFTNAKDNAVTWANKDKNTQFNALPANIQKVLINISYNLGSLNDFKNNGDTRQGLVQIMTSQNETEKQTGLTQLVKGIQDTGIASNRKGRLIGLIYNAYGQSCPIITPVDLTSSNACVDLVKALPTVGLVSLNSAGIPCTESSNNPNRCSVSKNYLPVLVKVNDAYKAKFGEDIVVTSSYRNQTYQTQLCTQTSGACAESCSNHMTGEAVDLSNATIGNCQKEAVCDSEKFNWLKQAGSSLGVPFYNNLGNTDNVHWSYNGH